jgi:response regulator NasT
MKARGLDEESAYRALRRMSMDQNRRIGEVARSVIGMADFLG